MRIVHVREPLEANGLGVPGLHALLPTQDNFQALLLQPEGYITVAPDRIGNVDQATAILQCSHFLERAAALGVQLAITPEYSTPWEAVLSSVTKGCVPANGALWVIGCESIAIRDLIAARQEISERALLIFEELPADSPRLVNPLVYVFHAPPSSGTGDARLVLLVQFKTCAMGDPDHFETNLLHLGEVVYQFGDPGTSVRLLSLICSDAFEFLDEHAEAMYDRTLLIHLQLNPKPRQDQFRSYRPKFLGYHGDATEILCLNWAQNVRQHNSSDTKHWNNIGGSAWYLKSEDFDSRDVTLLTNHRRGFYYTWSSRLRSHVVFFNYNPAVFLLTTTKVCHLAVAGSLSRRRGPQVDEVLAWNPASQRWQAIEEVDDGFASLAATCSDGGAELEQLARRCPLSTERALALSVGMNEHEKWYSTDRLDSCHLDEPEIIRRVTFCQDTDPLAVSFRTTRVLQFSRMWGVLISGSPTPASFKGLTPRLDWHPQSPHQNILFSNGARGTAIYLGENALASTIEATAIRTAEHLRRSSPTDDDGVLARQRLAVWYRNLAGDIELFDQTRYVRFDEPRNTSEFDFTRSS